MNVQEKAPSSARRVFLASLLCQTLLPLAVGGIGVLSIGADAGTSYGDALDVLGWALVLLLVLVLVGIGGLVYGAIRRRPLAGLAGVALGSGLALFGSAALYFGMEEYARHRALVASGLDEGGSNALAGLEAYNHTADYIHQYYVDGGGGSNIHAYGVSGNGSWTYPRQWHEGLTAKVRWTTSDSDPNGSPVETWHERQVPVEPYRTAEGKLHVHFLPLGQVRLILSPLYPGDPGYPGPQPPVPPPPGLPASPRP